MKKSFSWLTGVLGAVSFSLFACSETTGVEDPYANWEERNQHYIDSIAAVAHANPGDEPGQWKIIRSYKLPPQGLEVTGDVNDYVYCKILKKGNGDMKPLFTDTVAVSFRGRLMNGTVFSQNYKGTLDENVAVPTCYVGSDLSTGIESATMQMRAGDRWEVYIPYQWGYGKAGNTSIPGYSVLVFDWFVSEVRPMKGIE